MGINLIVGRSLCSESYLKQSDSDYNVRHDQQHSTFGSAVCATKIKLRRRSHLCLDGCFSSSLQAKTINYGANQLDAVDAFLQTKKLGACTYYNAL